MMSAVNVSTQPSAVFSPAVTFQVAVASGACAKAAVPHRRSTASFAMIFLNAGFIVVGLFVILRMPLNVFP